MVTDQVSENLLTVSLPLKKQALRVIILRLKWWVRCSNMKLNTPENDSIEKKTKSNASKYIEKTRHGVLLTYIWVSNLKREKK